MQTCGFTSLDPGKLLEWLRAAITSAVAANPYQFEPVHTTGYSDSENDSSESETTGKLH